MKGKAILSLTALCLCLCGCKSFGKKNSSSSEVQLKQIEVNVKKLTILEGKKGQLVGNISNAKKFNKDLQYSVTAGSDVISVSQDGVVNGLKAGQGEVTIKSTEEGFEDAVIPVTVKAQEAHANEAFLINDSSSVTYKNYEKGTSFTGYNAPATGNQKLLVVPVAFSDDKTKTSDSYYIEKLRKGYAGTKEETGWLSVKDYFYNASYGALNYDVNVVSDWFIPSDTFTTSYVEDNGSGEFVCNAFKWFKDTHPDLDLSPYDTDNNGIIDNVHFIFNVPPRDWGSTLWATTCLTIDEVNTSGLKVGHYVFMSLSNFISGTGMPSGGVNTRTAIHENGHMLGLFDYYDYASSGLSLTGAYDMQDNNVMDWNAFSKYSVGWVKPRYINEEYLKEHGSAKITLSSSSMDGDCLLIKNDKWIGNPFDEYLMIELFNPDGLNNCYDSHFYNKYTPNIGFGVKIFHVDSRAFQTYYSEAQSQFVTELVNKDNLNASTITERRFFNDNSAPSARIPDLDKWPWVLVGEENSHFNLLHLLQKDNINTFGQESKSARSYLEHRDLWQTGNTFSIGSHNGYTDYGKNFFYYEDRFNDGTSLPYGIVFDEVTENTVTLTVNYLG